MRHPINVGSTSWLPQQQTQLYLVQFPMALLQTPLSSPAVAEALSRLSSLSLRNCNITDARAPLCLGGSDGLQFGEGCSVPQSAGPEAVTHVMSMYYYICRMAAANTTAHLLFDDGPWCGHSPNDSWLARAGRRESIAWASATKRTFVVVVMKGCAEATTTSSLRVSLTCSDALFLWTLPNQNSKSDISNQVVAASTSPSNLPRSMLPHILGVQVAFVFFFVFVFVFIFCVFAKPRKQNSQLSEEEQWPRGSSMGRTQQAFSSLLFSGSPAFRET